MYQQATGDDPFETPMRIAPGAHFAMGGLWSDYDMMTSVPGLFVGGEVGWGYHGANRLGANSLLSACVDGWFTLPYSVPNYLAGLLGQPPLAADHEAVTAGAGRRAGPGHPPAGQQRDRRDPTGSTSAWASCSTPTPASPGPLRAWPGASPRSGPCARSSGPTCA